MSDSVRPHTRQPTRLPRPWDSPGKNTGVGCHFLLQFIKVKSPDPSSKATLWLKAQHEGALPPPCIVRKDPRARGLCRGAAGNPRVPRLLPGTLGSFPGCPWAVPPQLLAHRPSALFQHAWPHGELGQESQASSCLRKGTPLASRVNQGVSGPSSSCAWNPRVFAGHWCRRRVRRAKEGRLHSEGGGVLNWQVSSLPSEPPGKPLGECSGL